MIKRQEGRVPDVQTWSGFSHFFWKSALACDKKAWTVCAGEEAVKTSSYTQTCTGVVPVFADNPRLNPKFNNNLGTVQTIVPVTCGMSFLRPPPCPSLLLCEPSQLTHVSLSTRSVPHLFMSCWRVAIYAYRSRATGHELGARAGQPMAGLCPRAA